MVPLREFLDERFDEVYRRLDRLEAHSLGHPAYVPYHVAIPAFLSLLAAFIFV